MYTDIKEVSLVIAALACPGPCSQDVTYLGAILYTGSFSPESTNNAGYQYENITVPAPNWFDGDGAINVAHFYVLGVPISFRHVFSVAEHRY